MIDTVFIADLHLHPEEPEIQKRFNLFLHWAKSSVKNLYILGDFFHVWAGDDSINEWSRGIADQLYALKEQGINLFFIHGNRDFLLGKTFARYAGWQVLSEPTVVQLGAAKIMLAHGDRYCTKDRAHQRFRLVTRNASFTALFLSLPLKYRQRLVAQVRRYSKDKPHQSIDQMDVVAEAVIKEMLYHEVSLLIHGHTHKPGLTTYETKTQELSRYVLSDWDDKPHFLCYDNSKGLYFTQL